MSSNRIFIDITDYKIIDDGFSEETILYLTQREDIIGNNKKVKIILERSLTSSRGRKNGGTPRVLPDPFIKELFISDNLKSLVKFLKKEKNKFIIEYKSLSKLEKPVEDFLIRYLKLMGMK